MRHSLGYKQQQANYKALLALLLPVNLLALTSYWIYLSKLSTGQLADWSELNLCQHSQLVDKGQITNEVDGNLKSKKLLQRLPREPSAYL